jgi:hypothetical protein
MPLSKAGARDCATRDALSVAAAKSRIEVIGVVRPNYAPGATEDSVSSPAAGIHQISWKPKAKKRSPNRATQILH